MSKEHLAIINLLQLNVLEYICFSKEAARALEWVELVSMPTA
jgi:hypothetical protein